MTNDEIFFEDLLNLLSDIHYTYGDKYARKLLKKHYVVRKKLVMYILESDIKHGNSDN